MRILVLLGFLLLSLPAHAQTTRPPLFESGEVLRCPSTGQLEGCTDVDLTWLRLNAPETHLVRTVDVRPDALPLSRPLMVYVVATASSEIRWNGAVIGSNGTPARSRARERPGRFMAAFIVPSRLVRPGSNIVSARLSAHHLWLPVHRPVHAFEVGFYSNDPLPGLGNYLPALLALGALAAAGLYFAAAASLDRRDRGALLLALIAAMVVLQLGIETLRSFVSYSYPWHIARVAAIAILASATATLIAAYAARRFAPEWQRRAVIGTGAVSLACLLLVPWYDIKAIGALSAGMIGLQVVALRGIRRRGPGARTAAAVPPLFFLLLVWQRTAFLDQAYYVVMAAVLVALVAEQLLVLRQSRRGHQAEEERAASLEERLRELTHASVGVAVLKDGAKTHRVPEDQILFIKAADDYSEVQLESGRTLLVTMTLARLHATLSERFVRIHKSYVVNAGHVASLSPRPGGGRILTLTGGSSLPVGRSYLDAVAPLQTG